MKNILSGLIILILAMPPEAWAQNVGNNSWAAITASPAGLNLIVELKDGKTIKGKMSGVTESGLTLMRGKTMENIERAEVRKVYRDDGRSAGKSALIGAGVGGAGGAIVGVAAGDESNGLMSFGRKEMAAIVGGVGAAVGAITGFVIGIARHKKTLIYQA